MWSLWACDTMTASSPRGSNPSCRFGLSGSSRSWSKSPQSSRIRCGPISRRWALPVTCRAAPWNVMRKPPSSRRQPQLRSRRRIAPGPRHALNPAPKSGSIRLALRTLSRLLYLANSPSCNQGGPQGRGFDEPHTSEAGSQRLVPRSHSVSSAHHYACSTSNRGCPIRRSGVGFAWGMVAKRLAGPLRNE